MDEPRKGDYPYGQSLAAKALSDAIDRRSKEGVSLRHMAGALGYKSAVVLSHMRTGRLPIPIERAEKVASTVGLETIPFLILVLQQRYPHLDIDRLSEHLRPGQDGHRVTDATLSIVQDLEAHAGCKLEELSADHQVVLREVAAESRPRRRWLNVYEATSFDAIKRWRPDLLASGFPLSQRNLATIKMPNE